MQKPFTSPQHNIARSVENCRHERFGRGRQTLYVAVALLTFWFIRCSIAVPPSPLDIGTPKVGDHAVRILSPDLLELFLVNTKEPDAPRVSVWNWVNDEDQFLAPALAEIHVLVNGQANPVVRAGFKRRALFAPLLWWDLRIGNQLYLQLSNSIPEGAVVRVSNDGALWATNLSFTATADRFRYNPAIHVNQEGYLPAYPKKAAVGYYLGDLGEMVVPTNTFYLVDSRNSAVLQGTLTHRPDVGYNYTPTPYQKVYEADFSSWTTPGEYRLGVPGMGVSMPFRIDEGTAMAFARAYGLGMYQQRSGTAVEMPFTRFTHAADHTAPASVPTNASALFAFTWYTISNYATEIGPYNPPQTAPVLTNHTAQLFPFVRQGAVSVSGGHFEAGDYNRVTYNGAQLIHLLVFAADSLPGVGALDNLGIPESGDGISDALQEAKWEADFILKMQDADGAFFYSVYPRDREYELDVLPENGDPQVVWPKNTATTAAAVAALAQCASSPRFKQAFPQIASTCLAQALLGWQFLTNAIARHGFDPAYQAIQHFDNEFTHRDELAWAACELFLATGDARYQAKLFEWFPDPVDPATFRFAWRRLFASYGNVIRSYAHAVSSGRLSAGQLQQSYAAKCVDEIIAAANDLLTWSRHNAYGTSFPDLTKAYRGGGWCFPTAEAFDLAVAYQFNSNTEYLDVLIRNVNFEAGCNPVNVAYVTGLGWKRMRNVVDQYSLNDRRVLPKIGIPVSSITANFRPVWVYGWQLMGLSYPADSADTAPYAYYDRWCDDWNVSTEGSTTDMARSFAALAWLAARTPPSTQSWRFTSATLSTPATGTLPGRPVTVRVDSSETNLSTARIIWEAKGKEPVFGGQTHTFTPDPELGAHWVEAEIQWPDGRRAFALGAVTVSADGSPELISPHLPATGRFSFTLAGRPLGRYVIEVSSDLTAWTPILTNALPQAGSMLITDPQPLAAGRRYYRALSAP